MARTKVQVADAKEWPEAEARFKAFEARRNALSAGIDHRNLALRMVGGLRDRRHEMERTADHIKAAAEPFIATAERDPQKLRAEIEAMEKELRFDVLPLVDGEWSAFEEARQRETTRIAIGLQPRHREAMKSVAKALEVLSWAIGEERAVRAELADRAPLRQSPFLPDITDKVLAVGTLDEFDSLAHRFATAYRKLFEE